MTTMNIQQIREILPHRYPFLLVDRVLDCDFENKTIKGIKNVTANEPFFQGHFPTEPVMPGVLQLEAMAQLGGILLNQVVDRKGVISYFTAINNAKFRRIIIPGDVMEMEVKLLKFRLRTAKVSGQILVDGQLACQADMMFSMAGE